MRIPHKIRITADITYSIVWVDKFDDPLQLGFCDGGTRIIYLKRGMGKKEKVDIYIHELLHAIEFEYGIKIPHKLIYSLQGPIRTLFMLNPVVIPRLASRAAKRRPSRK